MSGWPERLRLAALRFHIPPEAFWRLSVKEWAALTAAPAPDAIGRKDFDALMRLHPDGGAAPHPALSPEGRGCSSDDLNPSPLWGEEGPALRSSVGGEGNRSTTP